MQTFFLVGAQKSGSTWLQRLLNDVPRVACFGESHFVDRLLLPVAKDVQSYNQMMKIVEEQVYEGSGHYGFINDPELLSVMQSWLIMIFRRTAGSEWSNLLAVGDKTPAHSFHMPILKSLLPRTRFVHMLRDGRDAAVSNYYHRARALKSMGQEDKLQPLEVEVQALFVKWKKFTQAVVQNQQNGCMVHTVRYEDLKANPLLQLQMLLRYLLPESSFEIDELVKAIQKNDFSRRSGGRKPGEISESSFLRQGTSGGWRQALGENYIDLLDSEGLELLQQLGYSI